MIVLRSRFVFACLLAMTLAACGNDAPAPSSDVAAPVATLPAAPAEAVPAADTAPEASTEPTAAPVAPAEVASEAATAEAAPEAAVAAPSAPILPPSGPEPREGLDYTLIDPPAPFAPTPGKIEVAEAFAYYCIHCSTLQARVTPWKKTLPADVEFRYVPMPDGQSEPLARAFFAAEAMGEHERSHEAMFTFALSPEHRPKLMSNDGVADLFAQTGVDRAALLSTMSSFAVNAQIARAQKAVRNWAIEGTPTFVVNGRYKASVTQDRGHEGMISTVEHLVARERARLAGTPASP
jgi:thiol:disulfide interchange protein DsbA